MSYITLDPEVMEILMTLTKARLAHHASGASLFGPDLSAWPPWAADALIAIEQERVMVDNAEIEAEQLEANARARRASRKS